MDMHRTWSNHLKLFGFNVTNENWTLGPSVSHLTSHILIKFSRDILSILQRQWCSNIKSLRISSALNRHVLESYSRTYITAAVYNQNSIDGRMSHRYYRYLKLVNGNQTFCTLKHTIWYTSLGEKRLPKYLNRSTSSSCSPQEQGSASNESSPGTPSYSSKMQSTFQTYPYHLLDDGEKLAT